MSEQAADEPAVGDKALALWYTAPEQCRLQEEICTAPRPGEIRVEAVCSAISRGTEGLVFRGEVPQSEWQRMRAPHQAGTFPFPVKYGYACVGRARGDDPELADRIVFSLHPHQNVFTLPAEACVPVPHGVAPERAVLAANMETALNALWDGKPSPGDHICVVGGGVVGLLTGYLAARLPGTRVTLIDVNPARAGLAEALGCVFSTPDAAPPGQDIVFHTSASAAGLQTSLASAGDGCSIIEMSWYGAKHVSAPLGADFHSRRLRLVSSQVGTIAADRQARWTYRRRLETALSLLGDPALDLLISHRIPFTQLPERLPEVLNKTSDVLAALVVYQDTL